MTEVRADELIIGSDPRDPRSAGGAASSVLAPSAGRSAICSVVLLTQSTHVEYAQCIERA